MLVTFASLLSAMLSGYVGLAGGSLLLAAMLALGMTVQTAVPVHAVVQLISTASRTIALLPHVRWRPSLILVACALPGPLLGVRLMNQLDVAWLKILIGLLVLHAAWVPKFGVSRLPEGAAFAIAGVLGGTVGVVLGAIGTLLAPFFLRPNWSRLEIVATQAVCLSYLHVIKIASFVWMGFNLWAWAGVIAPMLVAAIIGTYIGTSLLRHAKDKTFMLIYKVVLTALAAEMLVSAASAM